MKDLVEYIARALVDHPDKLHVTEMDGEKTVALELRCQPGDVGKVIGKNGKTVSAIRALLAAVGSRSGRRVVLEVID